MLTLVSMVVSTLDSISHYTEVEQELALSKAVDVIGNERVQPIFFGDGVYPPPIG